MARRRATGPVPRPPVAPLQLAAPLAVVAGSAGFCLAGLPALPGELEPSLRPALAAGLALGALVFGRRLERDVLEGGVATATRRAGRAALLAPVGGALVGASIAAVGAAPVPGWVERALPAASASGLSGPAVGLACGLVVVVLCGLVFSAALRSCAFRPASVAHASARRLVWAAALAAVCVATLGAVHGVAWVGIEPCTSDGPRDLRAPLLSVVRGVAAAGVIAIAVVDALALVRFGRIWRARGALRPWNEPTGAEVPAIDLGVGGRRRAWRERAANVYRDRERAVRVLIGNLPAARSALRSAAWRVLVAAALVVATVVLAPAPGSTYRVVRMAGCIDTDTPDWH
jgi:hypothetical protein